MTATAEPMNTTLEAVIVALRDLERVTLATLPDPPRDTVVYLTLNPDGGGSAVLSFPPEAGRETGLETLLVEWFAPTAALTTIRARIQELEAYEAASE